MLRGAWAIATILFAASALAQEIHVEATPKAADCPDQRRLVARIRELRRTAAFHAGVSAEVMFAVGNDGRHSARIRIVGLREGVRTMSAEESGCEVLAEAVATSLALLFDEDATGSEPPREAQAEPSGAPSADEAVGSAPVPSAPSATSAGLTGSTPSGTAEPPGAAAGAHSAATPSGGAALASGAVASDVISTHPILPGHAQLLVSGLLELSLPVGPGGALSAVFSWLPHPRIGVRLGGVVGTTHSIRADPGWVDVRLDLADLDVCMVWPVSQSTRGLTCVSAAAGLLRGDGRSYSIHSPTSRPYWGLGGALHLGGEWSDLFVWDVGVQALGALTVETFSVSGIGTPTPYHSSRWGVLAGGGLGVRLW